VNPPVQSRDQPANWHLWIDEMRILAGLTAALLGAALTLPNRSRAAPGDPAASHMRGSGLRADAIRLGLFPDIRPRMRPNGRLVPSGEAGR
jgi:hypothetical protein